MTRYIFGYIERYKIRYFDSRQHSELGSQATYTGSGTRSMPANPIPITPTIRL